MARKRSASLGRRAESITSFVMNHPLFGAHSHMQPVGDWAKTKPHFSSIAGYAGADLVTAAGPLAIGQSPLPPVDAPAYAPRYFELWRAARFTGYCRATELACRELLGLEYTEANADAVGQAIGRLVGPDPLASYRAVLQTRANVRWLVKDAINRPEDTAADAYPPDFIRLNYRDDDLLAIRSRADVIAREERWNRSVHSLGDLVAGLNDSIGRCLATGKVTCFKIGVAYQRGLAVAEPTAHEAEAAFNALMQLPAGLSLDVARDYGVRKMSRRSSEELRPLQDYLVHQYVRRAEAENIGIQVHTGYLAGNSGDLRNIRAMDLVPLLLRYPRVRFDLFHAGWPYTEEHAVIGKEYPNVWLNLCWAWAMNPVTMEHTLDSWLASVPHTKIFAYGGDTGSPICEYGYARQARTGIARVLERWIARGDMTRSDAEEVAADIMLRNACRFHGLEE